MSVLNILCYSPNFELLTKGVVVSAMIYGAVLSLTLSYAPLLLKTSYDISRRMRNFLLVYVTSMVVVSSVYIFTVIIAIRNGMFGGTNDGCSTSAIVPVILSFRNELPGALCIMLASWGVDGFMVSRFQKI